MAGNPDDELAERLAKAIEHERKVKEEVVRSLAQNQKKVSVVMIGPSGVGKSRICEVLGQISGKSGVAATPVTKETTKEDTFIPFNDDGYKTLNITVVDTIGIGDLQVEPLEILNRIIKELYNNQINYFFIVLKYSMRVDLTFIENMKLVLDCLEKLRIEKQFFKVIITHTDFLKKEYVDNYYSSLTDTIPKLRNIPKSLYLSFPDVRLYDDEHKLHYEALYNNSKETLLRSLWESQHSLTISDVIRNTWNEVLQEKRKDKLSKAVSPAVLNDKGVEEKFRVNDEIKSVKRVSQISDVDQKLDNNPVLKITNVIDKTHNNSWKTTVILSVLIIVISILINNDSPFIKRILNSMIN